MLDSPPAALGDALIVGSAIDDMTRARTPGAEVRALDGARLSGGGIVWAPIRGLANSGGPIVTVSGLVFIAAATDDRLRAFNAATGKELWQAPLPAGGQATPMTYVAVGRQFVVIAAGGNYRMGTRSGDAVVAFAPPSTPAGNPASPP